MVGMVAYRPISLDDTDMHPLADEAWEDGYPFVERMLADWRLGENRFDGPGARLIGAFDDGRPVGFCGLCQDPFTSENVGRLRHLYVERGHRRTGVARVLVARALDGAAIWFPRIRLRATPASRGFYEHLGFHPVDESDATHSLRLR
ncbi:hypothetical protein LL06_20680 [Hoeflea sp. BAL378]|nr:hypothetical protein LL06_20680 [Hoeflea sp. BAL378]